MYCLKIIKLKKQQQSFIKKQKYFTGMGRCEIEQVMTAKT